MAAAAMAGRRPAIRNAAIAMTMTPIAPAADCAILTDAGTAFTDSARPPPVSARNTGYPGARPNGSTGPFATCSSYLYAWSATRLRASERYSTSSRFIFSFCQYRSPKASRAARPTTAAARTNPRGKLLAPIEAQGRDLLRDQTDQHHHYRQHDQKDGAVRNAVVHENVPDAIRH